MKRASLILLLLLVTGVTAEAEYLLGFSLYRHTADADLIVLARVDPDGRATVEEVFKGATEKGALLDVDRDLLERTRKHVRGEPTHAFLFLAGRRPVLGNPGIAWIEEGKVYLVPDNWGWGECWLMGYRAPTPETFRQAIRIAIDDVREVKRIAKMTRGAASAKAASALLRKPRALDWYVWEGAWVDLGALGHIRGYSEELAAALYPTTARPRTPPPVPDAERVAWRDAAADLPPGQERTAHLWILSWASLTKADYTPIEPLFRTAATPRELRAAGAALLRADASRALALFAAELDVAKPNRTRDLLDLLLFTAHEKRIEMAPIVTLAAGLVPRYVATPRSDGNLGYLLVRALKDTQRASDLTHLLAMARSEHGPRAQALLELQALTKKKWKADDERWPDYIASLKELPAR